MAELATIINVRESNNSYLHGRNGIMRQYQINAKDTIILHEARYSSSIPSVVILVVPSSMHRYFQLPNPCRERYCDFRRNKFTPYSLSPPHGAPD